MQRIIVATIAVSFMATLAGCGTTPILEGVDTETASPAWSFDATPERLVVSVSPTRRSLQIAGSYPAAVGAGVDSVVNDRYRQELNEALGSYDMLTELELHLGRALQSAYGSDITKVPPMGTAAGHESVKQAEQARLDNFARSGHSAIIDLHSTVGLFTEDAHLVVKVWGEGIDIATGRTVWKDTILYTAGPALLAQKPGDPTQRLTPTYTDIELSTNQEMLDRWIANGGAELKDAYRDALSGVTDALLQSLDAGGTPEGAVVLARSALEQKNEERALGLYTSAISRGHRSTAALNGMVVALARLGRTGEATAAAKTVVSEYPEFGAGWLNLAWLYAVEQKDAEAARVPYERARELGMHPVKKIEKRLS